MRSPPSRSAGWSNLVLGVDRHRLAAAHHRTSQPMAQPGLTKILFAHASSAWRSGAGCSASPAPRCASCPTTAPCAATSPTPPTGSTSRTCRWSRLSQVWVGHWPLHWGVKYPFILVASFAVLFLSYHFLVRPTLHRPAAQRPQVPSRKAHPAAPRPSPRRRRRPRIRHGTVAVAQLRGITKKFGAVTALARHRHRSARAASCWRCSAPTAPARSTAISLWLGLIEADAGEVTLLGGSPQDIERRRGLGVMMQDVEMPKELRVRELVALASSYYDDPLAVDETLRRAGITQLADRPYGKLSGGQKRQAQFAVAICGRPQRAVPRRAHGGTRRPGARGALEQRSPRCSPTAAPSC